MSTAVAEKLEVCPKMSTTVRERMTKSRVRFLLTRPFYGTLAMVDVCCTMLSL